jgi:hypothetical protein
MTTSRYQYMSEFARRYVAEGEAYGRAEAILALLTARFGPVISAVQTRILHACNGNIELLVCSRCDSDR